MVAAIISAVLPDWDMKLTSALASVSVSIMSGVGRGDVEQMPATRMSLSETLSRDTEEPDESAGVAAGQLP